MINFLTLPGGKGSVEHRKSDIKREIAKSISFEIEEENSVEFLDLTLSDIDFNAIDFENNNKRNNRILNTVDLSIPVIQIGTPKAIGDSTPKGEVCSFYA